MRTHNVSKDDLSETGVPYVVLFHSLHHSCSIGRDRSFSWICISETDTQQNFNKETSITPIEGLPGVHFASRGILLINGILLSKSWACFPCFFLLTHPQLVSDITYVLKSSFIYSSWGYSVVVALYIQGSGFHAPCNTAKNISICSVCMPDVLI